MWSYSNMGSNSKLPEEIGKNMGVKTSNPNQEKIIQILKA